MKTVYGKLCPGCESVRACSQFGCRPIEQDTRRFRLSIRGAVLIASAIGCAALYGFALWLLS